jgi:hypothetical protein
MTTILLYKNRVYADSTVIKGTERIDSLTKIQPMSVPMCFISTREGWEMDDIIHGWTGTGSQPAMEGLIKAATTSQDVGGDIHGMISHFKMAMAGGLLTAGNQFEVILLGEKGKHSFRFDRDGFNYKFYNENAIVSLGSGCNDVLAYVNHHNDPVRAMLQTFATDEMSGGWIDCWELRDRKPDEIPQEGSEHGPQKVFRRRGMREPIPKDLIMQVLDMHWPIAGKDRVPLQYGRQAKFRTELTKVYLDNKQMATELDEKDAQIAQMEEDRVATGIAHENAIKKLKDQIKLLKKERKPITAKDLKLPPKEEVQEAAVVTTRRRGGRIAPTPRSFI